MCSLYKSTLLRKQQQTKFEHDQITLTSLSILEGKITHPIDLFYKSIFVKNKKIKHFLKEIVI